MAVELNKNCDKKCYVRAENPIRSANVLSKYTFWWLCRLFMLGLRQNFIDESQIYKTLPKDDCKQLTDQFEELWTVEQQTQKQPSVFRVIRQIYMRNVALIGFLSGILEICCRLAVPQCLGGLLMYFADMSTATSDSENVDAARQRRYMAYAYAAGLIGFSMIAVCSVQNVLMHFLHLGMRLRLTCSAVIYNKTLRLATNSMPAGLIGHALNLLSTDVARLNSGLLLLHDLWRGPVEFLLMGYMIYTEMGVHGLFGCVFLLAFLPAQAWVSQLVAVYRKRTASHADARLRIVGEVVRAIQVIKMYAWERWFAGLVDAKRKDELRSIRGVLLVNGLLGSTKILSRIAVFVSLISCTYSGNMLSARQVFVVSTYFSYIHSSMFTNWSAAWSSLAQSHIAITRIERYLMLPEIAARLSTVKTMGPRSVQLRDVSASWTTEERKQLVLQNVNLHAKEGELHVIIGAVGAGKSTVLQVILGELTADSGVIEVNGAVSYAGQEPWLFDGTVRQNIVFVDEFDDRRYSEVINACALKSDLDALPAGDATAVGERGISLSGGQRARISLARAVYKQADVYLLDDPLSAVDAAVGQHIYAECIEKFLKNKICILVTHQLQYLLKCKRIYLMDTGRIQALDSLEQLQNTKSSWHKASEQQRRPDPAPEQCTTTTAKSTLVEPAIIDESLHFGDVANKCYRSYFVSVESVLVVCGAAACLLLAQLATSAMDIFVAKWVSVKDAAFTSHNDDQQVLLITIYCSLVLLAIAMSFLRIVTYLNMCIRASRNMHKRLYNGVTETTMRFFQTNTSGRIINRFSKDIDNLDVVLPTAFYIVLMFILEMVAIVFLVMMTNVWLLLPTAVLLALTYGIRYVYMNTSCSLKRLESSTLSPMFNHTNATLLGLQTIRVLRADQQFANHFYNYQNSHTAVRFLYVATNQAFALWLEILNVLYLAIVIASFLYLGEDNSKSGRVGLAITQVINLIMMCKIGMRSTAILGNQMISIERISEYAELPTEVSPTASKSPFLWPQHGAITFKSVKLRYSAAHDRCALDDVCFSVQAGEKIGIVGRTGSGKSSIIQALFRLASIEGLIHIDGIDTATVSLHDLRNSISIIPQEAILFGGTVRSNLDPFAEHTDARLWSALELVELRPVIAALAGGLDAAVNGDGISSFSTGQRQLVSLARAILSQRTILILDEATANVDAMTDCLIMSSVRTHFKSSTVLTIAHRPLSIVNSDRVLVMDGGRVVEFDTPAVLASQQGGHFWRMCTLSGVWPNKDNDA